MDRFFFLNKVSSDGEETLLVWQKWSDLKLLRSEATCKFAKFP